MSLPNQSVGSQSSRIRAARTSVCAGGEDGVVFKQGADAWEVYVVNLQQLKWDCDELEMASRVGAQQARHQQPGLPVQQQLARLEGPRQAPWAWEASTTAPPSYCRQTCCPADPCPAPVLSPLP